MKFGSGGLFVDLLQWADNGTNNFVSVFIDFVHSNSSKWKKKTTTEILIARYALGYIKKAKKGCFVSILDDRNPYALQMNCTRQLCENILARFATSVYALGKFTILIELDESMCGQCEFVEHAHTQIIHIGCNADTCHELFYINSFNVRCFHVVKLFIFFYICWMCVRTLNLRIISSARRKNHGTCDQHSNNFQSNCFR